MLREESDKCLHKYLIVNLVPPPSVFGVGIFAYLYLFAELHGIKTCTLFLLNILFCCKYRRLVICILVADIAVFGFVMIPVIRGIMSTMTPSDKQG